LEKHKFQASFEIGIRFVVGDSGVNGIGLVNGDLSQYGLV
jgi:hypothetical protein